MLKELGWSVHGVEIDRRLCDAASSLGIPVSCGSVEDATFPPASFDLVRLNEVLEHLHDPLGVLRKAAQLVTPGGLVIVRVPNIRSMLLRLFGPFAYGAPGHLYGFNPETLTALCRSAGLKRVSLQYKSSKGAFSECLELWSRTGQTWSHRLAGWMGRSRGVRRFVLGPLSTLLIWCRDGDIMELWFEKEREGAGTR